MRYDLAKLSNLVEGHWSPEQLQLICEQIAPKASPSELELFLHVSKSRDLDPFAKQIYAVHRYDKRAGRDVMSIQVGIDGYRAIAERSGDYVGNDDPVFVEHSSGERPVSATAVVWRMVGGQRCAFSATARWSEYYPNAKKVVSPMWERMPFLMLGKCSEALALRKAFPSSLSGLYTDAEMDQAGAVVDAEVVRSERSDVQEGIRRDWEREINRFVAAYRQTQGANPKREKELVDETHGDPAAAAALADRIEAYLRDQGARSDQAQSPPAGEDQSAQPVQEPASGAGALVKSIRELAKGLGEKAREASESMIRRANGDVALLVQVEAWVKKHLPKPVDYPTGGRS